ncbi:SRPBCC domain-containing protein [Paenarthrobacter sp. NPDC056912]|uniref:SRPBCC domain-containing protein n=1 Tax=Paenarthrobacter sp. NPDC056912 TaxID=3345965 RepID=UPI00366F5EC8
MSGQFRDAVASVTVAATAEEVWEALTEPDLIRQYFLGTNVVTTWRVGDPITYSGEYNGKAYEDKGTILVFDPPAKLKTTHFSPASGLADAPENYHTVEYIVSEESNQTTVTIRQGNNFTEDEVEQSTATWQLVLGNLKGFLDSRP